MPGLRCWESSGVGGGGLINAGPPIDAKGVEACIQDLLEVLLYVNCCLSHSANC